jgi:thioredoxin-like negative regulator of GroEL
VSEAIAKYEQTKLVDPIFKIPARALNTLCWFGSLWNNAETVLKYCEQAVALEPKNWNYLDSRGIARALMGKSSEAIEDFQAFVNGTSDVEQRQQRQRWIEALRAGEDDPFTSEDRKSLFYQ